MKNYSSKFKNVIPLLIIGFALFPAITFAAILYLDPSSGEYQPGDVFMVDIKIDTEEECINTVEANLSFSQDILKAVDFSPGNSILTLWVKIPTIDQESGLISFAGGIPGGFCGKLPGEPGEINLLGKIIFQTKEVSGEQISAELEFLESSQVLLNDGFGTPAKLTTRGAVFTILAEKLETPEDEWKEELEKDNIPPEPFKIEIHQTPEIFEGKYFIIFSTTDKQTGIDYYEIREGKGDWKIGQSPYLLENQELAEEIKVKAVDKAGNEKIETIGPIKKPFPYWIIVLILIGGVGYCLYRKLKIKYQKSK